jgi:hypothetical protein
VAAAALQHPGQDVPREHHRCLQVEPRDRANLARVLHRERCVGLEARVVHEDVDRAVVTLDRLDQRVHHAVVAEVGHHRVAADLAGDPPQQLLTARDDGDPRPAGGEVARHRLTDAP